MKFTEKNKNGNAPKEILRHSNEAQCRGNCISPSFTKVGTLLREVKQSRAASRVIDVPTSRYPLVSAGRRLETLGWATHARPWSSNNGYTSPSEGGGNGSEHRITRTLPMIVSAGRAGTIIGGVKKERG